MVKNVVMVGVIAMVVVVVYGGPDVISGGSGSGSGSGSVGVSVDGSGGVGSVIV